MARLDDLKKLLAADPRDPFVLYALAQEHAKVGEHEAAIGYYDQCLSVDPAYHYAYFHKARTLEAAGRVDEAIATLRTGIASARQRQDQKAWSEMQGYLDELE